MTAPEASLARRTCSEAVLRARLVRGAAAIVIVLCAWCALLLLVWNLDRGFDLTDESYLLYLYRHPKGFADHLYWQHFALVSAFLPPSFDHVITYRVIKLTGLLALNGLLAIVLFRWIARRYGVLSGYGLRPIVLTHFVALGSLLAYCHGSQTLSYNDFTTLCLLGAAAALISIDLCPPGANEERWSFLFSMIAGGILIPLVFTKWSSGLLLAIYILAFTGLLAGARGWRAFVTSVAGAVCGVVLTGFCLTDAGIGRVLSFEKLFAAVLDPSNLNEHGGPSELLRRYAETSIMRFAELLRDPAAAATLVLPIATLVVRAIARGTRTHRALNLTLAPALAAASLIALLAFAGMLAARGGDGPWLDRFRIADLQTFFVLFVFAGAFCCIPFVRRTVARRDTIVFLIAAALIALLPAVGAIGTNNALLTQFIRHMGPLFAALAMLAMFLGFAGRWPPFAPVVCAVVAMFSTAQLFVTLLYHPYRLARPGIEQTVTLAAPPHMRGLKVDPATADFVRTLLSESQRLVGDTTAMPILAMFDIPGVIYILDAIAVGHPWHLAGATMERTVCDRLKSDPLARTQLRMIIFDRDEVPPNVLECLRQAGVDLSTYVEAARVGIPYPAEGRRMLRLLVVR